MLTGGVDNLAEAEVRWDAFWLDFQRVVEVLGSLRGFPSVGEQSRQVNCGTKVLFIQSKSLFE